ncbi:MAG: tetratricopeptide repeat protein [Fidelibacterota bacterium]
MRKAHIIYTLILVYILSPLSYIPIYGELTSSDRGEKLIEQKRYDDALKYYQNILKKRKNLPEARFNLGNIYYKKEDFEKALSSFEESLTFKNPGRKSGVFYNIGNTLFKMGKLEESLYYYKKALELNPDDYDAKFNFEFVRQLLQQMKGMSKSNADSSRSEGDSKEEEKSGESQQQPAEREEKKEAEKTQETQPQREEGEKSAEELSREELSVKEAEEILNALETGNRELLKERLKLRTRSRKVEKDW